MRWFTYAIAVAVVGLILDEVVLPGVGAGKVVSTLGSSLIPIALGVRSSAIDSMRSTGSSAGPSATPPSA